MRLAARSGAVYAVKRSKKWLAEATPYLSLSAKAIRIVAAAGGVAGDFDDALKQLDSMGKLITEVAELTPMEGFGDRHEESSGRITPAEGMALRRLLTLLEELDPGRGWGGLRRIQTNEGDFLCVCPRHYREWDSGLLDLSKV